MDGKVLNLEVEKFSNHSKKFEEYLKTGGKPGLFTGFDCIYEKYNHKDGGCTDWTGFPGSGKTYFLLEILFGLSENFGKRHLLYVPDIGSYFDVMSKLLQMKTGKNINPRYGNVLDKSELYKAESWLGHHFLILKRKDFKKPLSPLNFWEYVASYSDGGGSVDTGVIDSWKNLLHVYAGREDQYLDYVLSFRNELAEESGKHFHTIVHAVKTELLEDKFFDEETGKSKKKRRIPDAYDIKGGGAWFANGKNIITVDFPDKKNTKVDLYFSKIKPEDAGNLGSVVDCMYLDKAKKRYYELIAGKPHYNHKEPVIKQEQKIISFTEPNEYVPF